MERRKLSKRDQDFISTLPNQIGDKVKLKGPTKGLFSFFQRRDVEDSLIEGKEYTITFIDPASSWTAVYFEEIPDVWFNYHWFIKSEN